LNKIREPFLHMYLFFYLIISFSKTCFSPAALEKICSRTTHTE
jgi:hypothetical protein